MTTQTDQPARATHGGAFAMPKEGGALTPQARTLVCLDIALAVVWPSPGWWPQPGRSPRRVRVRSGGADRLLPLSMEGTCDEY